MIKNVLFAFCFKSLILTVIFTLSACKPLVVKNTDTAYHGFDVTQMDLQVSPSQNFYKYAVGNWIKKNPIPDIYTSWGTFDILNLETQSQIKSLLEEISKEKNCEQDSLRQKVRDFYLSGIDVAQIEREGYKPIKVELNKIDNLRDFNELCQEVARLHLTAASPIYCADACQNPKDSNMMIMTITQGGLGLPERDYYFRTDTHTKQMREKYVQYIKKMFFLIGESQKQAKLDATSAMKIETELASASRSPFELRDPYKNCNLLTLSKMTQEYQNLKWKMVFSEMGFNNLETINVGQPEFVAKVNEMLIQIPIEEWKAYLKWNLINSVSPYLSTPFVDANFDFYGRILNGAKQIRPRWQRVIEAENNALGEAVGELYVKKYFPPEAKVKAETIVHNVLQQMKIRIENLSWMSNATKKRALEKLAAFTLKIGYPKKWIDYLPLKISQNYSYAQNYMNAFHFDVMRNLKKIGKATDRTEWELTPQTVNAYYEPLNNEIVFPAAILQAPFFDPRADDALNYGAMGIVVAHETTHAFDDQGRLYDKIGNLKDWWTKEDADEFKQRTNQLEKQFNSYEPIKGYHVNGGLTLGENIADLGGVTISYKAFEQTKEYKNNKYIDGFSPQQRFFLGYAQIWRNNTRKDAQIVLLRTDPHAPPEYRVNGPLCNFASFIGAFGITPGSPMYKSPDQRIVIW